MSFNVSIDKRSFPTNHCDENDAMPETSFGRDADVDCSGKAAFLNRENGSLESKICSRMQVISLHHHFASDKSYDSPGTCGSSTISESDGDIPPPPPSCCSDSFSEHSWTSRCGSEDDSIPSGISEERGSQFRDNLDNFYLSTMNKRRFTGVCSDDSFLGCNDGSTEAGTSQLDSKIDRSDDHLDHSVPFSISRSCDLELDVHEATIVRSRSNIEKEPTARAGIFSIFKIARIFAFRCSLDLWKCTIKYCQVKESNVDLNNPSVQQRHMQCHAVHTFEGLMTIGMKRFAFSVMVEMQKIGKIDSACKMFSKRLEEAMLRCAFNQWTYGIREIIWREQMQSKNRRRLQDRVFMAWRQVIADYAARRKTSLLMMIVNRWRLWTEDCIAFRRKNYVALMHWASKMLATAFSALKVNAKVCEEKKLMSVGNNIFERLDEKSLTCRFSRLRGMLSPDEGRLADESNQSKNPFKITYRSPNASMVHGTPHYASCLTNAPRSSSLIMNAKFGCPRRGLQMDQNQSNNRFVEWFQREATLADNRGLDFDSENRYKPFLNNGTKKLKSGNCSDYDLGFSSWNSMQSNERYHVREKYQHSTQSHSHLVPGLFSASKKLSVPLNDNSYSEGHRQLKTGAFDTNDYTNNMSGFSNRAGINVVHDCKPMFIGQTQFHPTCDRNEAANPKILPIPATRITIIKEVSILLDEIITAVEIRNAECTNFIPGKVIIVE